jgi:hypothetical protein
LPSSQIGGAAIAIAIMAAFCGPGAAQPPPPGPAFHIANAVRIDETEAPAIDGDPSDPVWARAEVIDDFTQVAPDVGAPATERTEVRILYDTNNLYVSIYSFHSMPEDIVLGIMRRDGTIWNADHVRINLDPGATRHNGYGFQVSSSGGRRDLYLQNNTGQFVNWDTLWTAKTRVLADGWVAEYAIPFRSLSYDPAQPEWGIEIYRTIRSKNENIRWSSYVPAITDRDVTLAGTLRGISNVSQGLGLDLYVYGTGRIEGDWQGSHPTAVTGTGGATAFYRITPALTATLTHNPDFSDSPLDDRQVNITRFSLFFPETRDFFLRDAGAFEFGGGNFGGNNGLPYITRNIGLVNGKPVSIIAGGKVAGTYGGFDIGAVSALTADGPTSDGQVLTAVRLAHPVLEQSRVGMILTNGDPTGAHKSTLAGGDFQYRTVLFGDKVFLWDSYYERTFSSTEPEDDSFGTALNFPNEPWRARLQFKEVGENFRPRLGFANRRGIRQSVGLLERRTRYADSFAREVAFTAIADAFTDLDNRMETREAEVSAFVELSTNDWMRVKVQNAYDALEEPFDLPNNIPVDAGTYDWTNYRFEFASSSARLVQITGSVECCSYYNGDILDLDFGLNVFTGRYFEFGSLYQVQMLDMPHGSVDIHILSLNSSIIFTPDMSLVLEAQWDNISHDFAFNARYRWEYSPGNEVFVAFGQTGSIEPNRFVAESAIFSIRLGRTFQF